MILLVTAVFPPEPVVSASLVYDLAVALSENRKVVVITPKPTRPLGFIFTEQSVDHKGFEQVVLNTFTCPESKIVGRMRESYSFGKHVVNYIKKNRNEIECIYLNTWPLLAQYLIVKASKKYSIPSVVHVQDIYPESLSNKIPIVGNMIKMILLPIDKHTLKNASRIIAISNNMLTNFINKRGISADKINIVQNWQNESEFIKYHELKGTQKVNGSGSRTFTFMYLGNIGPVAKVDFLIHGFAKANIKESLLVIAGSGSDKGRCIKIAGFYQNLKIEFWDVPAGKVPETQEKANILLLPVRKGAASSSMPSKIPAYMFSARPVIASVDKNSDTADAIRQANCGWVIPPDDLNALAETMRIAVSISEEDRQRYGMNGFSYALENFSKKKNLQKLLAIIGKTIKE